MQATINRLTNKNTPANEMCRSTNQSQLKNFVNIGLTRVDKFLLKHKDNNHEMF